MKKKMIGIIAAIIIAVVAGYNVYSSQNNRNLTDLALANVDALASGEVIIGTICVTTCTYCWCGYFPEDYWADGEPYQ